ncbi:MAG: MFS transporter [Clostridia bacterium]|nr:MFS transporter [Clostridia bacterium]
MKLNYKRTLLVGFAFFLICTFWQAYDTVIPKILTDRYGLSQSVSGIIMALDNILALFMLPLFGSISDKCKSRKGKRTPFIFFGTVAAVAAFMLLTVADASQLKLINKATTINDSDTLAVIYDDLGTKEILTPEGDKFTLSGRYTREEFSSIKSTIKETAFRAKTVECVKSDGSGRMIIETRYKIRFVTYDGSSFWYRERETEKDIEIGETVTVDGKDVSLKALFDQTASYDGIPAFSEKTNSVYTNFVVPSRQAYIGEITKSNPGNLIWFMIILMVVLVAMSTFRSPAVALMPDVTVKPLRSKANAVINLMGTVGGMTVLVMGMGFAFANSAIKNTFRPWFGFFAAVSGIMLAALCVFMLTVKEPEWNADMISASELLEAEEASEEAPEDEAGGKDKKKKSRLSGGEFISLILILVSVALWYFGYNAVTSKYSVYATNILDLDYSTTLLIANAAAVISYLPVGIISSKVGRKKTILAGIVLLTTAFTVACFMRVGSPAIVMNVMFALAGIGWATINVNSFPMVVELSKSGDIGKYTGYYYAASMAAQALTPFVSGLLMDRMGMTVLFPYAAVFVALAFVTMLLVKHGDSKPIPPKSKLEAFDTDS